MIVIRQLILSSNADILLKYHTHKSDRDKAMPDADPNPLLNALRSRLQPLFDQYESLEYLKLYRGLEPEYGPHDALVEIKFEGMEEEDIDFSIEGIHRHIKAPASFYFIFYQTYWKLRVTACDPEMEMYRNLGDVLIHRNEQLCRPIK